MNIMIKVSLLLNMLVLIPVCIGFLQNANWIQEAYGAATPARGILFSVYLAILITSILLVFFSEPKYVLVLLLMQVIYKLTTPFTVESFSHTVVISNLLISAIHLLTLLVIFNSGVLSNTNVR